MQVGDLIRGRLSLGMRTGLVVKLRKRHALILWSRSGKREWYEKPLLEVISEQK
jgi:hypothetical protein